MNSYMEKHLKNVKFMDEHDWDGRCWPEEWAEVEGFKNGEMNARIEAFAAIRRAARVARERDVANPLPCNCGIAGWEELFTEGDLIRRAIRAAIGSEKKT